MSGYITFEERLEIESMIFQRCSFGEIAKKINKDRSTQANIMAEQEISISRKGALCDEAEIARLNAFVTPLILNGQSVHQIYCNNADTLMCSEKTLYNYIDAGFFDARNIDLPRKVRYRPRRKKKRIQG